MSGLKNAVIRGGLESLYFSGAHVIMRPFVGGIGAILTLHHVRPARPEQFQPNRLLEITPEFLEQVVLTLRHSGLDLVSLDEMHRRLSEGDFARRFACITIDDGYRDTLTYAYPILKRYDIPFTIYVATSFAERVGELWWLALEAVIACNARIEAVIDGDLQPFDCRTAEAKQDVFNVLYAWLRSLKTEDELRRAVRELSARYGVDVESFCRDLCMSWTELTELAADPLVTIGAHTVNHVMLAKVPEEAARSEMATSREAIEAALGVRVRHLSYPVGDPTSAASREFSLAASLGFQTGVTTRPGVLHPEHRDHLMALPRISINGEYQQLRYVQVLMSGAATAVWNRFRRVNAA
jgi:peptidoglycan/xylan/chitin deacetylase (PgdA/CDA1 family)